MKLKKYKIMNSILIMYSEKISFNKFCTKDVVIMPNITSFFFLFFFFFSYLFVHSQALVSFRYKITIYVIYCLLYIIIWSKLGSKSIFSMFCSCTFISTKLIDMFFYDGMNIVSMNFVEISIFLINWKILCLYFLWKFPLSIS